MSGHATKYSWRSDGEWFPVPKTLWGKLACCDCGLVHRYRAKVTKRGRVYFTATRDERETEHVRRKFSGRLTHKSE